MLTILRATDLDLVLQRMDSAIGEMERLKTRFFAALPALFKSLDTDHRSYFETKHRKLLYTQTGASYKVRCLLFVDPSILPLPAPLQSHAIDLLVRSMVSVPPMQKYLDGLTRDYYKLLRLARLNDKSGCLGTLRAWWRRKYVGTVRCETVEMGEIFAKWASWDGKDIYEITRVREVLLEMENAWRVIKKETELHQADAIKDITRGRVDASTSKALEATRRRKVTGLVSL